MHFSIFLLASSISPLLSLASSHSGINSQKHVIDWISVKKRVMEGTSFKGTSNSNSKKMRNFGSVIEERSSSSNKSISSWSTESASIQGALDSTVSALVNQANNVANIIGNSTALLSQSQDESNWSDSSDNSASYSSTSIKVSAAQATVAVKLPVIQSVVSAISTAKAVVATTTGSSRSKANTGSSSSSSSSGNTNLGSTSSGLALDVPHVGPGTFFEVGLGACGSYSVDTDYIVAVSYLLFDTFPGAGDNPNNNPICGKKLSVSYGSTTITVQVLDKCMGCEDVFALDFSPSAFSAIANQSQGRIQGVTWSFL